MNDWDGAAISFCFYKIEFSVSMSHHAKYTLHVQIIVLQKKKYITELFKEHIHFKRGWRKERKRHTFRTWWLLKIIDPFFLQSTGFTCAIIFPSHNGKISLSSVISSWITLMSKSSHSVLKKYLHQSILQYIVTWKAIRHNDQTMKKMHYFSKFIDTVRIWRQRKRGRFY